MFDKEQTGRITEAQLRNILAKKFGESSSEVEEMLSEYARLHVKDEQNCPEPEILCTGENLSKKNTALNFADQEESSPGEEGADTPDIVIKPDRNEIEIKSIESSKTSINETNFIEVLEPADARESSNSGEMSEDRVEEKWEEDSINLTLETTMSNNYMLLFVLYGTLASSLTR